MRHQNKKYKIGTNPAHRKALLKNLACEVIDHGKIKTTFVKCKAVQSTVEKLVTLAKEDSVANRRLAYSKLNNKDVVKKLFDEVGPKFKSRNGGYTRIVKVADARFNDGAKMGYIAFVE
ncbi:MAG: 50S ribosomal protein L17 [Bacteriovoracaceae bacterium]